MSEAEFKGTKGNWYLQKYSDAYTNIIRCDAGDGYNTIYLAATSQSTAPEQRANAALMSASLDLLEALQILLYDFTQIVTTADEQPSVIIAKCAISKALTIEFSNPFEN